MSLEECLQRIRSAPVPANEESAKFQIIGPILQHLGWDPKNPSEVLFEHGVRDRGSGRVDIALRSGNRLVALIEAKNPDVDLNPHVPQMLSYAFHEGVDICVLTNGIRWWFFLPREKGEPIARRFKFMDLLEEPIEQLIEDLVAFLRKDNLSSGEAERQAKLVLKANLEREKLQQELPRTWQEMLEGPDDELVELVTKRVYSKVGLRPSPDQVSLLLNGRPMGKTNSVPLSRVPDPSPLVAKPIPKPSNRNNPSTRKKQTKSVRPEAIVLWETRYPVKTFKDILIIVVSELYKKNPSRLRDAMKLGTEKHPYVTVTPTYLSQYFPLKSTEFYVYCSLTGVAMQERAREFLKLFGFEESDLEVQFPNDDE